MSGISLESLSTPSESGESRIMRECETVNKLWKSKCVWAMEWHPNKLIVRVDKKADIKSLPKRLDFEGIKMPIEYEYTKAIVPY